MENRNEKTQELDLDQMEKVSGGKKVGFAYVCLNCNATFSDPKDFNDHRSKCGAPQISPEPTSFPVT
jgi:hypothetical protein